MPRAIESSGDSHLLPEPVEDLERTHWQLVSGRRRLRSLKNSILTGLIIITVAGLIGFWLQLRP